MFKHLPFFESIGAFADPKMVAGKEHVLAEFEAALVILRTFDAWLDSPAWVMGLEDPVILAAREEKISAVHEEGIQHLFRTMLRYFDEYKGEGATYVVGPFFAYAWLLEERGWYTLAEDVLRTIEQAVTPVGGPKDLQCAIHACRKLGDLAIRQSDFLKAKTWFESQRFLAEFIHATEHALDARVRHAGVQQTIGNLGQAETVLTDVIAEARQARLPRVESFARRSRGAAMLRQDRPGDALREYYHAYQLAPDQLEREWLLGDLAGCLSLLGVLNTARVIHETLAQVAVNSATRTLALVNLVEVLVWDNDQVAFQRVWKEVLQRPLARDLRIHALFYHAKGIERFGTVETAIAAYTDVAQQAQQMGVYDFEFRALSAIDRLRDPEQSLTTAETRADTATSDASPAVQAEWRDIATAIEESCRLQRQMAM